MIRYLTILLILLGFLWLSGCSALNVERTITMPDGKVIVVDARQDDLVTVSRNGVEATVDGRGRAGFFENIMTMMFMKTDFNVSNKEGR